MYNYINTRIYSICSSMARTCTTASHTPYRINYCYYKISNNNSSVISNIVIITLVNNENNNNSRDNCDNIII